MVSINVVTLGDAKITSAHITLVAIGLPMPGAPEEDVMARQSAKVGRSYILIHTVT